MGMKDFVDNVLTNGEHKREYVVVVGEDEFSDFLREVTTHENVLHSFDVVRYGVADPEYVVTFRMGVPAKNGDS